MPPATALASERRRYESYATQGDHDPLDPALDLPAEVPGSLLGMTYFPTAFVLVSGRP
jgi:hypothetical protein